MAVSPGISGGEKKKRTQAPDHEGLRGFRRHLRLPARGPPARPLGRAGRAGAGPCPDARAGPGGLPAAAVAVVDHPPGGGRAIPDLVNRDFTAAAPGQKMVGDITYPDVAGMGISRDGD
jgi:hypothetical protein